MKTATICCMLCVACLSLPSRSVAGDLEEATNWTSFRNGGHSMASGELPIEWSATDGVAWELELTGYGQSTPVVFQGRVYVTSVVGPKKEGVRVTCLDLTSGDEIWSKQFDSATQGESNYMHSRAAPTPAVDEHGVYAFFEGGDLISLAHDGATRWEKDLAEKYGPFQNNHGLGSSLAQSDELVFLNLEHQGPSRFVAIDKKSGETRWEVERPSGSSWTSPIVISSSSGESVVVSSAGSVTAYEVNSGKEQWTIDGLEGNSVPSPTFDGMNLLIGARLPELGSTAEAGKSNLCMVLNDDGQFDIRWRATKVFSDYASPVATDGCVYYLNKAGVLFCLDLATGESHYTERLGVECWATPLVADGRVYFFGKNGETVVIKSGPTFEKVAVNQLWDLSNPPKPESYVEFQGSGHGHGGPGGEGGRGGMIAALMKGDANQDGILTKEEIPEPFQAMLSRVDLNADGSLDADELKAMEESFRQRREGSREGARDPIVYGIAAAEGTIVVRTGTRVYGIRTNSEVAP